MDFIDFFNNIPITVDTARRMARSASAMIDYTKSLLAELRTEPRDDFLGVLANAEAEEESLTEDEIVANAMLLLLAGHVAVRNLIGNVVYLLLTRTSGPGFRLNRSFFTTRSRRPSATSRS